ncbi:MAG: HIT domain-containing protein [Candidatus Ancillula trichonymphae]|jgi:ATP adenylyltransferase|nr:HIT domain-containing protein [Candidatus Ancillula trichonymphae]
MSSPSDSIQIEAASEYASQEDCFTRLWTPHRMAYVKGETPRAKYGQECPFCLAPQKTDEDGLIVHRGRTAYALMNLFPYNSAHMLICPYQHVSHYEDLTVQERDEIAKITADALTTLRGVIKPDGFNLGLNQGKVAGAGIAAHLHQHIVPRWSGDANFFPIVAQTKAVPTIISEIRKKLQEGWRG